MHSFVNDMLEDSLEVPKNVRGALQNNKIVRGASQNNKNLWSHVKLFGLNTLYLHNFPISSHP